MALIKVKTGGVDDTTNLGRRNLIINGAMEIDQRNNNSAYTLSGSANFSADRYKVWSNITSGSAVQVVSDAPSGFTKSMKITVGTGATPTGADYGRVYNSIEGYDWAKMRWGFSDAKDATISFWVKSSVTGTFGVGIGSGNSYFYNTSYTVNSANTWEYKTVTISGYTSGGITEFPITNGVGASLMFDLGEGPSRSTTLNTWSTHPSYSLAGLSGGTKILATSGATWQVTGIQIEEGSSATPFEHRPYAEELALCQRYYYDTGSDVYCTGYGTNATGYAIAMVYPPSTMRVAPTVTNSGLNYGTGFSSGSLSNTMIYLSCATTDSNAPRGRLYADAEL